MRPLLNYLVRPERLSRKAQLVLAFALPVVLFELVAAVLFPSLLPFRSLIPAFGCGLASWAAATYRLRQAR